MWSSSAWVIKNLPPQPYYGYAIPGQQRATDRFDNLFRHQNRSEVPFPEKSKTTQTAWCYGI